MTDSISIRRMAENEVVFRKHNEAVIRGMKYLKKIATEDKQESHLNADDEPLYFYCECSDENCKQRITMSADRYADIHTARDKFTIVMGHEAEQVEKVVATEKDYSIVEKFSEPSSKASELSKTDIKNS